MLLALFAILSSIPASAATLTNAPSAPLLQAFQGKHAALLSKIDAFLSDVDACNPPVKLVRDQIMNGFGGSQPDSAKNLLALSLKNVSEHVNAAETKFSVLAVANGACTDKSLALAQVKAAADEAQANLGEDASDLKAGMDGAAKKKGLVIAGLNLRQQAIDHHLPAGNGDVARCEAAKAKIPDMEAANAELAQSLTALQTSFSDKATFMTASLNAPGACKSSSLIQKASFEAPEREANEATETPAI